MPTSPFDFDVSVRAAKARGRRRTGMSGAFEAEGRRCDWRGCEAKGCYRAPMGREHLDAYYWFCLDHVREYNKRWDFFRGMTMEEIEARQDAARRWERETRSLGGEDKRWSAFQSPHAEGQAWRRFGFSDPLQAPGERATINPGDSVQREARHAALPKPERNALSVLGLDETADRNDIRARYGELVKALHPDHNGGDRSAEDRLKRVIEANAILKKSPYFRA